MAKTGAVSYKKSEAVVAEKLDFLENYDLAEPVLSKLYTSKLRAKILYSLGGTRLSLADLGRVVNAITPNVSAKLKELDEMGLVVKEGGCYRLTAWGDTARRIVVKSLGLLATINKFGDFWDAHLIEGIPPEFVDRLDELAGAELVKSPQDNVTLTNDNFVRLLGGINKRFYGVSPIYHSSYLAAAKDLVSRGVDTKLILTPEIRGKVFGSIRGKERKALLGSENVEFYECEEDIKIAFTVSENFTHLGLFLKDNPAQFGIFQSLVGTDEKSVGWGADLFEHYRARAKLVELGDYL